MDEDETETTAVALLEALKLFLMLWVVFRKADGQVLTVGASSEKREWRLGGELSFVNE